VSLATLWFARDPRKTIPGTQPLEPSPQVVGKSLADPTVAEGRLTSSMGIVSRWEIDQGGIRFYNDANELLLHLDAGDGSVLVTGTLRNAPSGTRWELLSAPGYNILYGYHANNDSPATIFITENSLVLGAPQDAGWEPASIELVPGNGVQGRVAVRQGVFQLPDVGAAAVGTPTSNDAFLIHRNEELYWKDSSDLERLLTQSRFLGAYSAAASTITHNTGAWRYTGASVNITKATAGSALLFRWSFSGYVADATVIDSSIDIGGTKYGTMHHTKNTPADHDTFVGLARVTGLSAGAHTAGLYVYPITQTLNQAASGNWNFLEIWEVP
jgi:hypothetical protein